MTLHPSHAWPVHAERVPAVLQVGRGFHEFHPSPDGCRLAVACDDGTIHLVSVDGIESAIIVGRLGKPVQKFQWSPDGTRIVADYEDSFLRVWKTDGKGEPYVLDASPVRVELGYWSCDGKVLAMNMHLMRGL